VPAQNMLSVRCTCQSLAATFFQVRREAVILPAQGAEITRMPWHTGYF
jgi:hypothetical protein